MRFSAVRAADDLHRLLRDAGDDGERRRAGAEPGARGAGGVRGKPARQWQSARLQPVVFMNIPVIRPV